MELQPIARQWLARLIRVENFLASYLDSETDHSNLCVFVAYPVKGWDTTLNRMPVPPSVSLIILVPVGGDLAQHFYILNHIVLKEFVHAKE
jgi:hypothetical protein